MELLFVILPAFLIGGALIYLLKKYPAPRPAGSEPPPPGPFQGRVLKMNPSVLGAFLTEIVEKGGHRLVEAPQTETDSILLRVEDPHPLGGGTYLIRFCPRAPGSPVTVDDLSDFSHLLKQVGFRKGLLMTCGDVTPQARESSESGAVELLDGVAFEGLCARLGMAPPT